MLQILKQILQIDFKTDTRPLGRDSLPYPVQFVDGFCKGTQIFLQG